jgi:hypothetical protein
MPQSLGGAYILFNTSSGKSLSDLVPREGDSKVGFGLEYDVKLISLDFARRNDMKPVQDW